MLTTIEQTHLSHKAGLIYPANLSKRTGLLSQHILV